LRALNDLLKAACDRAGTAVAERGDTPDVKPPTADQEQVEPESGAG
jgi:hypothetical protein